MKSNKCYFYPAAFHFPRNWIQLRTNKITNKEKQSWIKMWTNEKDWKGMNKSRIDIRDWSTDCEWAKISVRPIDETTLTNKKKKKKRILEKIEKIEIQRKRLEKSVIFWKESDSAFLWNVKEKIWRRFHSTWVRLLTSIDFQSFYLSLMLFP